MFSSSPFTFLVSPHHTPACPTIWTPVWTTSICPGQFFMHTDPVGKGSLFLVWMEVCSWQNKNRASGRMGNLCATWTFWVFSSSGQCNWDNSTRPPGRNPRGCLWFGTGQCLIPLGSIGQGRRTQALWHLALSSTWSLLFKGCMTVSLLMPRCHLLIWKMNINIHLLVLLWGKVGKCIFTKHQNCAWYIADTWYTSTVPFS